jgi:hypothetical protein
MKMEIDIMLFRAAACTAAGLTIAGMAFTAGVGLGVAAVGGACLARQAMKKRRDSHSWKDDHHDTLPSADAMPDEGEAMPGANPA